MCSFLEGYITDLHKKYKQKTVKRKLASVKAFYNYPEEEGIITEHASKESYPPIDFLPILD